MTLDEIRKKFTERPLTRNEAKYLLDLIAKQREALKSARSAMKQHDEAYYQCESTEGAEGAMKCVEILDEALKEAPEGVME